MGMFDSFYLTGKWAQQIRCPAGHPFEFEMQTKDLENVMATVVVQDDGSVGVSSCLEPKFVDYQGLSTDVVVGGECPLCKPIYLSTRLPGRYNHCHPNIEARLRFVDGRLIEATVTAVETLDDIRCQFENNQHGVKAFDELPEDAEWPLPWSGQCLHGQPPI